MTMHSTNQPPFFPAPEIEAFEAREAELRKLWERVVKMALQIEEEYNNLNFEAVQWWRTELAGMDEVKRLNDAGEMEICRAPHYHMLRMTENSAMPETIVFKKESE